MFQDLQEGVLGIFAEAQGLALDPYELRAGLPVGFHELLRPTHSGAHKLTPERREYIIAHHRAARERAIEARLLAGERPSGSAAKAAVRRVAAALGIELPTRVSVTERRRAERRAQIRARLLAGERPKRFRSPMWREVASELGVTLGSA